MRQFVIRVRAAPRGCSVVTDAEVASFDTQEEAEYFMSLALKLHALRHCKLAVARVDAGAGLEVCYGSASPAPMARQRSG